MIILLIILTVSLVANGILIWYTRKIVQNMFFAIKNVDEMQKMLDEYAFLLEPILRMENYWQDPEIAAAIANTKMVIDACKVFKKSMIVNPNEEFEEDQENNEETKEEQSKKTQATISNIPT